MALMQTQMYASSGFGDLLIIIITTTTTTVIIPVITTSWRCAPSWCFINDSNWINPTRLWLRVKRPDRRGEEGREAGCFPSASYPGKTQQASEQVYPDAFPRALENVERNTSTSEYMFTVQGELPRKNSLSPHEVFLCFELLTMSPWVDRNHQPNFQ